MRQLEIIKQRLAGSLVAQSKVLIKTCETDWLMWNKQSEFAKISTVLRTELETKPSGVALILKQMGAGRLLGTTLPAAPHLAMLKRQSV